MISFHFLLFCLIKNQKWFEESAIIFLEPPNFYGSVISDKYLKNKED